MIELHHKAIFNFIGLSKIHSTFLGYYIAYLCTVKLKQKTAGEETRNGYNEGFWGMYHLLRELVPATPQSGHTKIFRKILESNTRSIPSIWVAYFRIILPGTYVKRTFS